MPILTRSRIRRSCWVICAVLLLIVFSLCVPVSRSYILRSAGQLLVVQNPSIKSADVIVLGIDSDGAGTLAAADLVRSGVSNRVAVFHDPPTSVDQEFLRRGLPYEDRAAVSTRQLELLGIQSVEQISRSTSGSEQEGVILPDWCEKRGYHSVVLVTSKDHSKRLTRILRRSLKNSQTRITVFASPYSEFDAETWWSNREGVRTEIVELEKLTLDFVRHPFS
jgi:uncharacterized SAM-binding protein YcdF (DUF218 family)